MPAGTPMWRPSLSAAQLQQEADVVVTRHQVNEECERLLAVVRQRCPGLLPGEPLPAGTVTEPIELDHASARRVMRLGMRVAAGTRRSDSVLWRKGDIQLLVHISRIEIGLGDGTITVNIPVQCDETGHAQVSVIFAVGSSRRAAGVLATTEDRPRGPIPVVTLWSDELVALAWRGVMEAVVGIAGATGEDEDGAALVPATMAVTGDHVAIAPMARHSFDRVRQP